MTDEQINKLLEGLNEIKFSIEQQNYYLKQLKLLGVALIASRNPETHNLIEDAYENAIKIWEYADGVLYEYSAEKDKEFKKKLDEIKQEKK